MKRSLALEAFLRDHDVGLILARQLSRNDEGVGERFLEAWHEGMLLGPLATTEHRSRLFAEHREIKRDAALLESGKPGEQDLEALGTLLRVHIRWEERFTFTSIEEIATPEQVDWQGAEPQKLEDRRAEPTISPRRGELVQRRKK